MKPAPLKPLLFTLLAAACCLFWTACIPSLQPPYTEKDLLYQEELVGTWNDSPDNTSAWTFTKEGPRLYRLVIQDKENSSPFDARLFKLGDQLFLDLYPHSSGFEDFKREDFFRAALVPAHIFFKVGALDMERFEIYSLDHDWLRAFLAENPGAVAHTKLSEEDGRIVFTDSTAGLQKFLREHVNTAKAWGEPGKLTRAKAK